MGMNSKQFLFEKIHIAALNSSWVCCEPEVDAICYAVIVFPFNSTIFQFFCLFVFSLSDDLESKCAAAFFLFPSAVTTRNT